MHIENNGIGVTVEDAITTALDRGTSSKRGGAVF
jgi:hypothetical protein